MLEKKKGKLKDSIREARGENEKREKKGMEEGKGERERKGKREKLESTRLRARGIKLLRV